MKKKAKARRKKRGAKRRAGSEQTAKRWAAAWSDLVPRRRPRS
jgi:hypothetical protein